MLYSQQKYWTIVGECLHILCSASRFWVLDPAFFTIAATTQPLPLDQ